MFDLILSGGRVVGAGGVTATDIAVSDGVIAALLPSGAPAEAHRILDVTGTLVLPGLVDAHVHLREPGLTQKEDFVSGTRAAAAGGVTTVLVMPTDDPWTSTSTQLAKKMALATDRCCVDIGFQIAVSKAKVDLVALRHLGAISFEVFTADVPKLFLHATLHELLCALQRIGPTGALACVSAGDQSILIASDAAGGRDVSAFTSSRPPIAEASGIARTVLAASALGARVHLRQSNSALGIATFGRLRSMADVSIETTVQNLIFTDADYLRLGAGIKASPPFRRDSDVEALRAAVRDGTVDIVATDHAPHSRAEKSAPYDRFGDVPGGMAGLQTLLPMMLHLVDVGVLGLTDIARLCAANPAERFGIGHRKGRIAVGLDADLVVVDPAKSMIIRSDEQYSKAGYTPFDGLSVPYHLALVFLRGQEIASNGQALDIRIGRLMTHAA